MTSLGLENRAGLMSQPVDVGAARDDIACILLRASRQDLNDKRNRFVPRGNLVSQFDHEKVSGLLGTFIPSDKTKVADIASFISPSKHKKCRCDDALCTGLRIIFATLFLLGKQELILNIYQSSVHICDGAWPCSDPTLPTYFSRAAEALREVLQALDAHNEELFHQLQWHMRSPYFSKSDTNSNKQPYHLLHDEVTLPWSELNMQGGRLDGQVSFVQRIKIHQDHHDFLDASLQIGSIATLLGPYLLMTSRILASGNTRRAFCFKDHRQGAHD